MLSNVNANINIQVRLKGHHKTKVDSIEMFILILSQNKYNVSKTLTKVNLLSLEILISFSPSICHVKNIFVYKRFIFAKIFFLSRCLAVSQNSSQKKINFSIFFST